MALLFRHSADHTLRSVDDQPGVVGLRDLREGPSFVVDPSFEPDERARQAMGLALATGRPGVVSTTRIVPGALAREGVHVIDLEDAIAALEGPIEFTVAFNLLGAFMVGAASEYAPRGHFDAIARVARFCARATVALADRMGV